MNWYFGKVKEIWDITKFYMNFSWSTLFIETEKSYFDMNKMLLGCMLITV